MARYKLSLDPKGVYLYTCNSSFESVIIIIKGISKTIKVHRRNNNIPPPQPS